MQVVIWLVFCFLVSLLARNRRPGPVVVFIIAMFLSPLIGLAVALFAKKKQTPPDIPVIDDQEVHSSHSPEEQPEPVAKEDVVVDDMPDEMPTADTCNQESNIIYCDSCGQQLESDSAFCPNCGKAVE